MGSEEQNERAELRERLDEVWERIVASGGSRDTVSIIGVTKTHPIETVARALAVGLTDLGENRGQDLADRPRQLDMVGQSLLTKAQPTWHFIGGLQRNKIKQLVDVVALWHSIDRDPLIRELENRSPGARVLIQVNTTDEAQKSGCVPEEAPALVDQARNAGLSVEGLMTIGPTGGEDPRPCFDRLRKLAETLDVSELSMGMSGDFEQAVEEGATMLRLGSVLFGGRS